MYSSDAALLAPSLLVSMRRWPAVVFAQGILRHFSMRAIAPIAVASISSSWFSQQIFGSSAARFRSLDLDLGVVLPAALLLGPAFGLIAVMFMICVRSSLRFATTSGWSPARLVFLAAGITGMVGVFVPEILGLGSGPLRVILEGGYADGYLVVLLAGKMFLTALCIGFGLFGGVFSPALFVGAAAGPLAAGLQLSLVCQQSQHYLRHSNGGSAVIGALRGDDYFEMTITTTGTRHHAQRCYLCMISHLLWSFLL